MLTDRYYDGQVSKRDLEEFPTEVEIPTEFPVEMQDSNDVIIAKAILRVWDVEDARYSPFQAKAIESWDQYHLTYAEEPPKDSWQSNSRYSSYLINVERLVAILISLVDSTPDWFEIESIVPQHQVHINIAKRLTKFLIEHDSTQWKSKLAESLRSAIITGQAHCMVVYEKAGIAQMGQEELAFQPAEGDGPNAIFGLFSGNPDPAGKPFIPNPHIPKIRIDNWPSRDVRLDSTSFGRYKVWQQDMPIGLLYDQATACGYNKDGCQRAFNKKPVSTIRRTRSMAMLEQNLGPDGFPDDPMVTLTFFEGTLPHYQGGDLLFRDKYVVLAEDEVIYGPSDTPWWDGEFAMVSAPLIPVPHCVYGKSFLAENIDGFKDQQQLVNAMLDYCAQVVYGKYEVDQDKLVEEQQRFDLKTFPGQVFYTENSNGQPVVRRVQETEPGTGFFQFLQAFGTTVENATGMSNQLGGASRTRGRQTSGEFQTRNADAGNLFNKTFEEFERRFIAPTLRLVYLRGLQFMSDDMWKAWVTLDKEAILPKPDKVDPAIYQEWAQELDNLANLKAKDRYKKLASFYRAKVRVFSSLADRQAEIEKGQFFIQQAGKIPDALKYIRLDVMMSKIARAIGYDPEEVLNLDVLPSPKSSVDNNTEVFKEFMQPGQEQDDSGFDLSSGVLGMMGDVFNPQQPAQPQQGGPPPQFDPKKLNTGALPGGPVQPSPNPVAKMPGLP